MTERLLIPVRRADDVLIFEYYELASQRRWHFRALLCQTGADGPLERTGAGAVTDAEIEASAQLIRALPRIERSFADIRLSDAATFRKQLHADPSAAVVGGSMLFTLTLYLSFMRQYLVEESSISAYEERDPAERFEIGMSASIYDGLIKRHDLARAERILNADLPHAKPPQRQDREWAYFYKVAAEIKARRDATRAAVVLLERSAELFPQATTLRRIGNLSADLKDRKTAISAFERSDGLEPLPAGPRLRLAWCYFQEDDHESAQRHASSALKDGNENAAKLIEKLTVNS